MHAPERIVIALIAAFAPFAPSTQAPAVEPRWTFDGSIHNNSLAIDPDETTAVVSYSERPEVIVYELRTGKVRGTLPNFVTPRNIVFHPTGGAFYVSDSSLGVIVKVETTSLRTLATLAAGPGAFGTTMSKDGKTLYVNNEAASTVTVFDLGANRPKAVITGFAQPRQGVRLSPDEHTLFVTNFLGDKVSVVDAKSNKIEGEIVGFSKIRAISITRDGKTLFAANSGTNEILVVDVETRAITARIPVGKDPYGAALTPDERFLVSGNLADNSLTVVSLRSRTVVSTVTGLKEPRQAIEFTRDGKFAYVLNNDLSVSRVDVDSSRVVSKLLPP